MIKHLIFDYGQVLVRYNPRALLSRFYGNDEEALASLLGILADPERLNAYDRGTISLTQLVEAATLQHPEHAEALAFFRDNEVDEVTNEIEGMRPLLADLKRAGYGLYGLTNWGDMVYPMMRKFADLFALLDGMVISCEEHTIKPEPEIYLRLCGKFSLKPEECLFTDDRPANIEGARRIGMQAVLFTSAEQYATDLKRILRAE